MSLRVQVSVEGTGEEIIDLRITNRGPTDMTSTPGWEDDRHYRWVAFGPDHSFIAQGELDHRRDNGATMLVHRVMEDLASVTKRQET